MFAVLPPGHGSYPLTPDMQQGCCRNRTGLPRGGLKGRADGAHRARPPVATTQIFGCSDLQTRPRRSIRGSDGTGRTPWPHGAPLAITIRGRRPAKGSDRAPLPCTPDTMRHRRTNRAAPGPCTAPARVAGAGRRPCSCLRPLSATARQAQDRRTAGARRHHDVRRPVCRFCIPVPHGRMPAHRPSPPRQQVGQGNADGQSFASMPDAGGHRRHLSSRMSGVIRVPLRRTTSLPASGDTPPRSSQMPALPRESVGRPALDARNKKG